MTTTVAAGLGLEGAPIQAPTHFSQFDPLLAAAWGDRWFVEGAISAHFLNMVIEGEDVQAAVTIEGVGATEAVIGAHKTDGTPVLEGTASLGTDYSRTALAPRLEKARQNPPDDPFIYAALNVGQQQSVPQQIRLDYDSMIDPIYPFSLSDKLAKITESLSFYGPEVSPDNPFGRPIVPVEMVSVMSQVKIEESGLSAPQLSPSLFIDLEVRLLAGPVFVDHPYRIERELLAVGGSRRTESTWVLTTLVDEQTNTPTAQVLLHFGVFKQTYPGYPAELLG